MKKRLKFYLTGALFLFLWSSCDEYLLKKTVVISEASGSLTYTSSTAKINGEIGYEIQNKQDEAISEIYLLCHPSATVESVSVDGKEARIDAQTFGGYGITRVRTSELQPGETASLSLSYSLSGPIDDSRFVLKNDEVFLDPAAMPWLPVPFADTFDFQFEFTVTCPNEYYALMGGKLIEETDSLYGPKSYTWESELEDPLSTGTLFIKKMERSSDGNLYFYSTQSADANSIFDYCSSLLVEMDSVGWDYPLSQLHFAEALYDYDDSPEMIDGEFIANLIFISPEVIKSASDFPMEDFYDQTEPLIPENSELHLLDITGHEMFHAYVGNLLKFESGESVSYESLTEFLSQTALIHAAPAVEPLIRQNNRFLLMNSRIAGVKNNPYYEFILGVSLLGAAFSGTNDLPYTYLNILIEKYRYIDISREELLLTLGGMERFRPEDDPFLFPESLDLWKKNYELENISVSVSNMATNDYSSWPYQKTNYLITVSNGFCTELELEIFIDETESLSLVLEANEATNFFQKHYLESFEVVSPLSFLEANLFDNFFSPENDELSEIEVALNAFYEELSEGSSSMKHKGLYSGGEKWQALSQHKLNESSAEIFFRADCIFECPESSYLAVFKEVDGTEKSYCLIQFDSSEGSYSFSKILDILQ